MYCFSENILIDVVGIWLPLVACVVIPLVIYCRKYYNKPTECKKSYHCKNKDMVNEQRSYIMFLQPVDASLDDIYFVKKIYPVDHVYDSSNDDTSSDVDECSLSENNYTDHLCSDDIDDGEKSSDADEELFLDDEELSLDNKYDEDCSSDHKYDVDCSSDDKYNEDCSSDDKYDNHSLDDKYDEDCSSDDKYDDNHSSDDKYENISLDNVINEDQVIVETLMHVFDSDASSSENSETESEPITGMLVGIGDVVEVLLTDNMTYVNDHPNLGILNEESSIHNFEDDIQSAIENDGSELSTTTLKKK